MVVTLGMSVHVAALGARRLVSSHNIVARWQPPRFYTILVLGGNADLADTEPRLRNARHDSVQSQQARDPS